VLIGKAGVAKSALCTADAERILIRGRDLSRELMGRMTFTEFFFFLMTGKEATDKQRFFLDLLLVAIAEHGLTPTAIAARMTYDADPQSLQGALAAGILGCGSVILGTAQLCGDVLVEAVKRVEAGEAPDAIVTAMASDIRARGGRMPGFGHPVHRPVDPRTTRIFALAVSEGVSGRHVDLARRFKPAVDAAWGKPLVMNVSMPIAAVLLDLDFPATMIKAIPLLARTGGLLAHLAEEQQRPIGFLMASHAEEAIAYDGGDGA
jgi:citrate synthase